MINNDDAYGRLLKKIAALKEVRAKHETLILNDLQEVYDITQDPSPYLKRVAGDLAKDSDFRNNLLKIGLNLGSSYLNKWLSATEKKSSIVSLLIDKLNLGKDASPAGNIVNKILAFLAGLNTEKK